MTMGRDPIDPGETLSDGLEALGISAAEPARRIKVPVNRITGILDGRRTVAGDTSLRLARVFTTSGEVRLDLRKLCKLRQAERKNGAAIARLSSPDSGNRSRAPGRRGALRPRDMAPTVVASPGE